MHASLYLSPVGYHGSIEDRLLLQDEAGRWYLWMGESETLTEIDPALARWVFQRPEVFPVLGPAIWFEPSSLPVRSARTV